MCHIYKSNRNNSRYFRNKDKSVSVAMPLNMNNLETEKLRRSRRGSRRNNQNSDGTTPARGKQEPPINKKRKIKVRGQELLPTKKSTVRNSSPAGGVERKSSKTNAGHRNMNNVSVGQNQLYSATGASAHVSAKNGTAQESRSGVDTDGNRDERNQDINGTSPVTQRDGEYSSLAEQDEEDAHEDNGKGSSNNNRPGDDEEDKTTRKDVTTTTTSGVARRCDEVPEYSMNQECIDYQPLTLSQLNSETKRLPMSVQQVYDLRVTLKDPASQLIQVRKITRESIFPKMKFVSNKNRDAVFDRPPVIQPKTVQYCLLDKLAWLGEGGYVPQIDSAIRWNTYSKEVERTLSQCRSTALSTIKKSIMQGM